MQTENEPTKDSPTGKVGAEPEDNSGALYDVLIIGSGPAGLSASLYTARAGLSTALLTGSRPGGMVSTTGLIENYLGFPEGSGVSLSKTFLEHSKKLGAEHLTESASSISRSVDGLYEVLTDTGRSLKSKALIYAAGSEPRRLEGLPGGDSSAISYCATCDGAFYEGEEVYLVGGGETAYEDALYLSGLAKKVTVLVRREASATGPLQERLEAQANVEILKGVELTSIELSEVTPESPSLPYLSSSGDEGGEGNEGDEGEGASLNLLEALLGASSIATAESESGKSNPSLHGGERIKALVLSNGARVEEPGGLFLAIGQVPNSYLFSEGQPGEGLVELDQETGFIKSSQSEGLFLAGDIANPEERQIAVAVGDGARAGMRAVRWLSMRQD